MHYISPVLHFPPATVPPLSLDGPPESRSVVAAVLEDVRNRSMPIGIRSMVAPPVPGMEEPRCLVCVCRDDTDIDPDGLWEALVLLTVGQHEPNVKGKNLLRATVARFTDLRQWPFGPRVYHALSHLGVSRLCLARELELYPDDAPLLWGARKVQSAILKIGREGGYCTREHGLEGHQDGSWVGNNMAHAMQRSDDAIDISNELLTDENKQRRLQGLPVTVPEMEREQGGCLPPGACSLL